MRALSFVGVLAAAFGAVVAFLTFQVMCFDESWGSRMCPNGSPTLTMTAQLVVGLVGFAVALLMAYFAARGSKRAAFAALIAGLVLWAGWAFLNDAAVHGWGHGMRLI